VPEVGLEPTHPVKGARF